MPTGKHFLDAFNFRKGLNYGYVLETSRIKEQVVKLYREYKYPIIMKWQPHGNFNAFKRKLNSKMTPRIVFTKYGNPYRISIEVRKIGKNGNVFLTGHAFRINKS